MRWYELLHGNRRMTHMTSLFSINPNLALVQVWNEDPVPLLVMQMLRLPFDFVSHAPPFLSADLVVNCWLVEVGMPTDACMHM